MRWRDEGVAEAVVSGLESGGLFLGFVFRRDIFLSCGPQKIFFGDVRSLTGGRRKLFSTWKNLTLYRLPNRPA